MVDIIDSSLWVYQLDQILDNLDDILLCQDTDIHISIKTKFLIDTVTAYITKVVTFVREEQVLYYLTSTCIIGRICITQLTVDVKYGLLLRVWRVFGQCIEDDWEILSQRLILVDEDCLSTALQDLHHIIISNLRFALHDYLIALDRDNLTSILIYEILVPALQHMTG